MRDPHTPVDPTSTDVEPADEFRIPSTIEEAITRLDGIGRLVTARQWERAAIVHAFVAPERHGGDRRSEAFKSGKPLLNIRAFARLGIVGLRHGEQVRADLRAWEVAMRHGASDARPGDRYVAPNLAWEDRIERSESAATDPAADPAAVPDPALATNPQSSSEPFPAAAGESDLLLAGDDEDDEEDPLTDDSWEVERDRMRAARPTATIERYMQPLRNSITLLMDIIKVLRSEELRVSPSTVRLLQLMIIEVNEYVADCLADAGDG